ncbi:beta-2-microglobulin-like protein [Lates japonicus]|uniref:Beta-2-microglobulin-like protein n=1 Tax=Lates japonicus TaxID=270547 RepID=A0AAD3QYA6_LATJO|nr:beta-2-microglobulin-like protein [Lates japonicus]
MRPLVCALLLGLLCLLDPSTAKESAPKVQVYSRGPGEYGKTNTIICHTRALHPKGGRGVHLQSDSHGEEQGLPVGTRYVSSMLHLASDQRYLKKMKKIGMFCLYLWASL